MMRCASCGYENPDGVKFCNECAAAFPRLCLNCGFSNPPAAKFCGECAAQLGPAPARRANPPASQPALSSQTRPGVRVVENGGAPPEGERKTVTALFADIKGSMDLMEDRDPEEARAIVDPALKLMIDATHRYDGYIVQSTGDGIFALFGAPVAHEDHPQRALYAALRMQEEMRRYSAKLREAGNPPLEARVGINTGETVVRSIRTRDAHTEYTPIGHSTSLASRMQTLAPTGSIAVTETTQKLCVGYFTFRALGPSRVKGVTEPVNVFEVTGLGPLRTRLQRSVGRGLTKFVGRVREMEAMQHAAEQARAGHGQIVAAMAEAGTGKSRLFFEFKAKSERGWMVLETFSVSHGKASAYLPLIELLWNYFKITSDDDERTRREKVAGRLAILDPSLEDTRPYIFALLGIADDADPRQHWEQNFDRLEDYLRTLQQKDPLAQMDGQVRKRRTLEAIKRILLRESLNQPLMVIFEDLHWIDEETQALLNLLADSIATAKILLLVNYRPEYTHSWGNKTYYTQLRLDPLGKDSAEEMLSAMLGDSPQLVALKRVIVERTEGNPFFMEETVQVLLDEGALVREGAAIQLIKPLRDLKIPPTVQAILAARIDRLPPDEKDLLQALAVLGKEFKLSIVGTVTARSLDEINRMLGNLQLAEFIYEQPAIGDIEYSFKHALTQEVAYNSLLIERRKLLHERTGAVLESMFAEQLDDHLEELAHHFSHSNNTDKALEFLRRAGKQARDRNAYAGAEELLERGLKLLGTLPESAERDNRELSLQTDLEETLLRAKGFITDTTRAAARAAMLAERIGNLDQMLVHLNLLWVTALLSSDRKGASVLADQMLLVAQREGTATSLGRAYLAQLRLHYYGGQLTRAEEDFTLLNRFQKSSDRIRDPYVTAYGNCYGAACALLMGRPNAGAVRLSQAKAFARESNDPFVQALASDFESYFYYFSGDPILAETAALESVELSRKHQLSVASITGTLSYLGWARARRENPAEGLGLIQQALENHRSSGNRINGVAALVALAEAHQSNDDIPEALAAVTEALQASDADLTQRPRILTCRGNLHLKIGELASAEADFRDAAELSREMSAKLLEMRATVSLARLLAKQNRRDEARAMLAEIYHWFTEGFDTADLKDAKALLEELDA